ncbi:MAG TPA: acetate/propionate family kinase [Casimicrobiaceae bacterium]|nr:acetate/propionate family kinase [Casimicrobiaceae bacterium]
MSDAILVINAGSSSLKFAVFSIDGDDLALAQTGIVDNLLGAATFAARNAGGAPLAKRAFAVGELDAHDGAIEFLLDYLGKSNDGTTLAAVGHRVVHGGERYVAPVRLTPAIVDDLARLSPLAPLHQPHNLAPIRIFAKRAPGVPQVACFDTAFHATAPAIAQAFALPRELSDAGIRRYGFHGLSYEFIAERLRDIDGAAAAGRVVVAHLGNGASMCAMVEGRSVATTMGLTALDGLVMGTRTGSIDPGVLLYLMRERGMDEPALSELLYKRSGLLGVSGVSSDMRALEASDDANAAAAIDLFCYRAVREIGSLAAAMGGIDALVFTAGIGEHAAPVREKIVLALAWLGFALDEAANAQNALRIAPHDGKPVYAIPTDEERMIARHTRGIISA